MKKAIILAAAGCLLALPAQAAALKYDALPITSGANDFGSATTAAQALIADPITLNGDSILPEHPYPSGGPVASPIGKGDRDQAPAGSVTGFPTNGTTWAILSSGNINDIASVPNNNDDEETDYGYAGQYQDPGSPDRGDAEDYSVLKVNVTVPAGTNCMALDYRFLSEEFPNFVGSPYNDAFIAEVDTTSWTVLPGGDLVRPNDVAVSQNDPPISVNGVGPAAMFRPEALPTYFNAATGLVTTKSAITPGNHSVYLSLFDSSDSSLDSAVFLDNLRFISEGAATCKPPEQQKLIPSPAGTPAPPTSAFSLGSSVKFTGNGTKATITVNVPGPGLLSASSATAGTASLKAAREASVQDAKKKKKKKKKKAKKLLLNPASVKATQAGAVTVTVALSPTGKKALKKRKLTIPVSLTFARDGGSSSTQVKTITFKKAKKAKKKGKKKKN